MGNQHSVPDKDKEREKDKDKDRERDREREREPHRAAYRHENQRSRTHTSTLLPPTETKVNGEQTPTHSTPITTSIPTTTISTTNSIPSSNSVESPSSSSNRQAQPPQSTGSVETSPVKERRTTKNIPAKDIVDGVKNINIKDFPRPNEEEIRKEQGEIEPAPKFETMRVPSQTSIVDEDELKEADKSGIPLHTRKAQLTMIGSSEKVPLVLDWNEGGKKVAVTGTFTGWRKRINLRKTYYFLNLHFGERG